MTPPPVEPGDAPMNISRKMIKMDGKARVFMLMVLKPAVLAVTDWKREDRILACKERSLLVFSNSSIKIIKNHPTVRNPLLIMINFVCKVSFEKFFILRRISSPISLMTKNPIPPQIINTIKVIFTP